MTLPYSTATSGERAISEVQKILRSFGCQKFGHMMDYEHKCLLVQFEFRGIPVSIKASISGYAAAYLKENPWSYLRSGSKQQYESKALDIASRAVYSIVRDWIKGQITAVETGMLTFEGAFLGHILLPTGKTLLETVNEQKLLPQPSEEKTKL